LKDKFAFLPMIVIRILEMATTLYTKLPETKLETKSTPMLIKIQIMFDINKPNLVNLIFHSMI
jgi:hypothetical protein